MNDTIQFLFIGNNWRMPAKPSERYIMALTLEENERAKTYPFPEYVTGTVVLPAKIKPYLTIGETKCFCNPYYEMVKYGFPVFVKSN